MKKHIKLLFVLLFACAANASFAQQTNYAETAAATKSSKDPGFQTMLKDSVGFKKALGTEYYSRMHKLIFRGDIQGMFAQSKSWDEINKELQKLYGPIGEEAYLLTRAGISMQSKQWPEYLPLAQLLLQKYGSHLSETDRKKHQDAIAANK